MTGRPGRTGRTTRSGSQAGAGDLLELVRSGRATTRGALQQATGLSRATVGQRLDRLFRAGWLREGAGGPVESPLGGRPSITLEFDDAHAVVLAAEELQQAIGRPVIVGFASADLGIGDELAGVPALRVGGNVKTIDGAPDGFQGDLQVMLRREVCAASCRKAVIC